MRRRLGADDVLNDIEFELIQGAISQDELGQSIQIVKRYQNKLRHEMMSNSRHLDSSQVIARLFRLNNMIITLLQEAAAAINSLRLESRHLAQLSKDVSKPRDPVDATDPSELGQLELSGTTGSSAVSYLDEDLRGRLEAVMQAESLEVNMDVRERSIPVIGWFIKRLRIALHDLVLFYVKRLADRQLKANWVYGDSVLRLFELYENQQERINELNMELRSFRVRYGADEFDGE